MGTAFHKLRPELPARVFRDEYRVPHAHPNQGLDAMRRDEEIAAAGSTQLRDEIKGLFVRAEREHGLRPGDGVHLLLNNGVRS